VIIAALILGIGYQVWLSSQPQFPLDLNSAPEKHLIKIAGVDEALAKKIIAGRPYKRKDELVHKHILNEVQYEQIKDKIVARHN
jgi:DNA uptake protein ComE-like DNA-binding protein